jgi:predicted MFS family arabinose efflux permease
VSLAYFVGRIVPLDQLIRWVAQFAVVALLLVITWILFSFWMERRQTDRAIESSVTDEKEASKAPTG